MPRSRLLTYSLIAAICALAALVSWQTGSSPGATRADRSAAISPLALLADTPAAALELAPREAYNEIIERPLFTRTRRPPAPEKKDNTPVKAPKPQPAPEWKLVGTAITSEKQTALLWDIRNRRFVRLAPGMKRAGWEIAAVQPEAVLLSRGKVQHEIKLPRF